MGDVGEYRPRRGAGYLRALYDGGKFAYRNRESLMKAGRRIRRFFTERARKRYRGAVLKKIRATRNAGVKRAREWFGDPASYRQMSSVKRKRGRKIGPVTRQLRLLKTVTEPLRFRFGDVNLINAAEGAYWLTQQPITDGTTTYTALPIYVVSLCNTTNGTELTDKAGWKMYELCRSSSNHIWRAVYGIDPVTLVSTGVDQPTYPTQDKQFVGRRGMLDWTRLKLCFWGKKKNPSTIRIRLVKFLDEELCPEECYPTGGSTGTTTWSVWSNPLKPKATEYWSTVEKYLMCGHMGYAPRADRKKYVNTIKSYTVNLNPIDAAAETDLSDPRGHMKHFDLFNRWNKVCDYTNLNLNNPQSIVNQREPNFVGSPFSSYSGVLKQPQKGYYYIIESVEPRVSTAAAAQTNPRVAPDNKDFSVSFDLSLDTNFTTLEKQVIPA